MKDNNFMILIIALLVIAVVWWYMESEPLEKAKDTLYGMGTLYPITDETTGGLGCDDPDAINYNPDATYSFAHSCYYKAGCCDVNATNYDPDADSCWQENNSYLMCDYGAGQGVAGNNGSGANYIAVFTDPYFTVWDTQLNVNTPNDCTCANLTPASAWDCVEKNANNEVLSPPVCVGVQGSGAEYCNSIDYPSWCSGTLPTGA
jgi:hypothetical protein